jgi:hypothetical protein
MRRGHCVDTGESMAMKLAPFFEEEYNDGCRFLTNFAVIQITELR